MIKIRIKNDDHEIDIRFPISENELYAKLAEIHTIEGKDAPQSAFVTDVYWPEELSVLKDRFANLDELNYLARRMESFDYHEYDQFLIGVTKLENLTEKDLINLTFNLDHFTLCKDVSSYGKIGREYVMNTEGAVPAHDEDDPKYAVIGKDLIDRGLAQITAKGLLIYNPFNELTEVYDGQTFPEYYYENSLASADVSYNGRTELLLLPGEELAIQKALARLGAPSDSDCDIKFCLSQGEDDAWEERIESIIRSEGLHEANKMLRSLDTGDMDWGKLTAAVELADVKSAANIAAVAEHLGEFAFILNKTYIRDCLSKKVMINNGERPKYYVENNHPAIIESATFGRVQEEMARRCGKRKVKQVGTKTEQGRYSSKYALTELLICGECGTPYRRCTWVANGKKKVVWRCMPDTHKRKIHRRRGAGENLQARCAVKVQTEKQRSSAHVLRRRYAPSDHR